MDREELDRILGDEDELVPSSGFVASVMERVETEAAAPAPIPFPWKRAVPGMVVAVAVLVWAAVEMARAVISAGGLALPRVSMNAAVSPALQQAGWVALALVLAWAGWRLARRFSG
ncbi:MAG TPA: hypothetical protein VMU71_05065 [Terracidiphilus sp.]|nr:hypothetical protein [Terracidiphilus sp.]